MKIVHLMKNEKFTKGIVHFYDKFFNTGEHEILYYKNAGEPSLINAMYSIPQREFDANKETIGLIAYLKSFKYDYIVLHSIFLTTVEKIQVLNNKKILKKMVWIEWGADLYSWRQKASIKNLIKNHVNYQFRNNIQQVICIFPPDMEYYHGQFPKSRGTVFYAPYRSYPVDEELLHYKEGSRLKTAIENRETIYVQIGQNSLETLNHIRVLQALEKFKDENIRILLPLSYGGLKEYAEKVEKYAELLFPGKVTVLRDFIPREDYYKLIEKISIAIFDTERQCGLGNINRLNFRNVKVYLSENGMMYKYFRENGVPVKKCEDIKKMSFNEFIQPSKVREKAKFKAYINTMSCIDIAVNQWRDIYESMRLSLNAK